MMPSTRCFVFEIVLQVNQPTDESVLSALALTFKQGRADEDTVEIYENAFKALPQSDSLADELFSAYIKVGDFKKTQQVQTHDVEQMRRSLICAHSSHRSFTS